MTDYHLREISGRLVRALNQLPVIVLSGLRQTGKSTLLQNESDIKKGHKYKTLDDFGVLAAARANPESLLKEPVILDEVQRSPDLLIPLKKIVDKQRRTGRFILSGSANLALLGHVSETLAGRAGYFTLHPMTRREINNQTNESPFIVEFLKNPVLPTGKIKPVTEREVLIGGLPPACLLDKEYPDEWFRGYIQTYVERDVRQLSRITDLISFRTLTQLAALRTAQVLVISSLARDSKLNAVTTGRYLNLLETSFLICRIPPFLKNRSSRLIKAPKLHFTDCGLASHLAGITSIDPGKNGIMRGALFETYVVQNIKAILDAYLPDANLSYWHEQGRYEVDLVIESGETITAIEIKASSQWNKNDLKGLNVFLDRTPDCTAAVLVFNGSESFKLGDRLWAISMGHLLQ